MGGYRNSDPATSRWAFEEMERLGLLSKGRLAIAREMSCAEAPLTAGELASRIKGIRNNVATRLSEMEQLGVVFKDVQDKCSVSKLICWKWSLTGEMPKKTKLGKAKDKKKKTTTEPRKFEDAYCAARDLVQDLIGWLPPLSQRDATRRLDKIVEKVNEK